MGDDDLGPEGFGTRGIPSARRGYDKRVVDTLVSEAVERWGELKRLYDELRQAVDASGGLENLQRDVSAVGEEVNRILEAARDAGEGMRLRALADSEQLGHEATAAAAEMIAEAEAQAFELRREAWETGTELLDLVRQLAGEILAEAADEAALIRAEAEKEAHRRLALARKEQDEMIRSTRFEIDRHVAQARDLAAEMLSGESTEETMLSAETSSEERRRRLMSEIDRLRAAKGIEGVKVLSATPPPEDDEILFGELDPQAPGLSEALAAEVERLSGERPDTRPVSPPSPSGPAARPAPATGDDLGTLFEALRTPVQGSLQMDEPSDAVSLRERVLLPLHNVGVREIKRRVVDLQNAALAGLRQGSWVPDPAEFADDLHPALEPAITKAAAAGLDAARVLAGVEGARPGRPRRAHDLVVAMTQELASQLRAGIAGNGGDPSSQVSRVFRAWRTDEAERWVRAVVDAAYHDQLLEALAGAGFTSVRAVAPGATCTECPAAGEITWDPAGAPPDGYRLPPAHPGCTCTITPA
ncbi:MAG: hypothetical protein QY307_09350 [Acidimicrobiia bacterium]|nr:MAG: hypothetical protein QY307_09350 [Acidimicrobiia bacterium]